MIIKILFSIFVVLTNFLIYKGIRKQSSKNEIIFLTLYGITIVFLNYILDILSNMLILFLLLFSLSILILNLLKENINVFKKSNLLDSEKVERVKFIMVNVIMPIMITIYQFIIIWSDKLFDKMIGQN